MQAIQASWAGRTFGAVRCSTEKKTRSRRTKEERKTMVESFIKKYQNLNNGKFPSLNLTHKEVGGSFYTVREIVREIIQNNRVLGPGNLSSKALNLEYFPEEHEDESLPMEMSAPLSISTRQEANCSLSDGYKTSLEIIELDESANQECLDSNLNDMFVTQVLHAEECCKHFPNGAHVNGMQPTLGSDVSNLGKQSEVVDDKTKFYDENYGELKVSSSEAGINSFEQSPPVLYVADEKSVSSEEMCAEDQATDFVDPDIHKLGQPTLSPEVPAGQCGVSEQAEGQVISSGTTELNMVEKPSPLSEVVNDKPGVFGQTHGVQMSSLECPGTYNSEQATPMDEALPIIPSLGEVVGNGSNGSEKRSELARTLISSVENNSSSESNSLAEAKILLNPVPPSSSDQMQSYYPGREYFALDPPTKSCNLDESQEKDMPSTVETQQSFDSAERVEHSLSENFPITIPSETTGTVPSIAVNEVSEEIHNKSVSQNRDYSASPSVEQPLLQSNKLENVITNIKSTSRESLQPTVDGRLYSEAHAKHEFTVGNTDSAINSGSVPQGEVSKESETLETDNFWTAVKSFLNAVVKFWTE